MYWMYIVRCADGTLYTGIAIDVRKRVAEHNGSSLGAKYTRSRRPVTLVYARRFRTRSSAQRAEAKVKAMPRAEKLRLCRGR